MRTHIKGTGMPGPDQLTLDIIEDAACDVDDVQANQQDADLGRDQSADEDTSEVAANGDDGSQEGANYRDRNPELRRRYTAALEARQEALAEGDADALRTADNDIAAIGNEFYTLNKGLAIGLARRFTTGHDSDPDYTGAANLGLWEAFLRWDPTKGTTFGYFSRQYISGRIQRTVRSVEFAHLSQSEFNLRRDIRANQARLSTELGRTPTAEEIANASNCTADKVERALSNPNTSMDTPLGDGAGTFADIVADKVARTAGSGAVDLEGVDAHLDELSDLELWVAAARSDMLGGDTPSLIEVADQLGLGREVIRRAEARAWMRLAAAHWSEEHESVPTDEQLVAHTGKPSDHVAKYRPSPFEDLKSRYGRIRAAIRDASCAEDRNIAAARMDRFGEEFLTVMTDLADELGSRHFEDGEPIGSATAAWAIFSAFLAWDPTGTTTFPTYARKSVAAEYGRARSIDAATTGETLDVDVTWAWIRRQILLPV